MKTIGERATEYADREDLHVECGEYTDRTISDAYAQGATDEHRLLTTWHDPDEYLPAPGTVVLVKLQNPYYKQIIRYSVSNRTPYGQWQFRDGSLEVAIIEGEYRVVGWREIHES